MKVSDITSHGSTVSQVNITCSCGMENSFAEKITRSKLIVGLDNKGIKLDILSMQEKWLEDTVKCSESKESGKIARKKVGGIEAKVSVVKTEETSKIKRYRNCNKTGHSSSIEDRERSSPAWGKSCHNCGKEGHFKACWKSLRK